jgi:hypothetical protein
MARPHDFFLALLCAACEVHGTAPSQAESASRSLEVETPVASACPEIRARRSAAAPVARRSSAATGRAVTGMTGSRDIERRLLMGMGAQTQQFMKGLRLPPGVKSFDTPHGVSKPLYGRACRRQDYDVASRAVLRGRSRRTTSGGRPRCPATSVEAVPRLCDRSVKTYGSAMGLGCPGRTAGPSLGRRASDLRAR